MTPTPRPAPSRADAAARISAYVYGNVLILTALISQHPTDASSGRAALIVFATGLTTYLAHTFAEALGERVRTDEPPSWTLAKHELRNALPIASSTTIPVLLLVAAALGWLPPAGALLTAQLVTVIRMGLLGLILGHLRKEKSSFRSILTGILIAVAFAGIAGLKAFLTH
ncbi:hypothetical protein [Mycetocola spongiae]|uniref:hypothetical protein n=1 Tax=Mycetocola spongiae TaxID=2859226 RepID=UPI001CF40A32|nr:hypothetical protein [Mycetocola spongiae]UCR89425.1 hypothetical protein KXZ72_01595 [Mycetocola spongiae]